MERRQTLVAGRCAAAKLASASSAPSGCYGAVLDANLRRTAASLSGSGPQVVESPARLSGTQAPVAGLARRRGFDDREIQRIIDEAAAAAALESLEGINQDTAPALPDAATTRTGDLWVLGDHRLLCGDSSKREDVDRLLGGARIQLVNMDPHYKLKVEPRSNKAIGEGARSTSC